MKKVNKILILLMLPFTVSMGFGQEKHITTNSGMDQIPNDLYQESKTHNGDLNSATSSDEGTYSSPQDTTKKEKKKDYVIDEKRNINSVQFVRRRKGHKVKIHFRRMKFIPKRTEYMYFVASSGIKYFDQKPIEIREVEFPFWVRLKFKASNQTQTQFMYYTLHFTINKPGYWEIIMDY